MATLTSDEVLEQLLQHAPKMNAPVAEVGRRILEKLDRADGLFRAADLELNRLKVELGQEKMAREDADRRFAESAMDLSKAHVELEQLREADRLSTEYLRALLRKVDEEQKGLAICSWCALPTTSDAESKRAHQMVCPQSPLVTALRELAEYILHWQASGVEPAGAVDAAMAVVE